MKRIIKIPQFRNAKITSENLEYEKNSKNYVRLWKAHKTIHVKNQKDINEQIEKGT